jgi:hypothetical protein
MAPRPATYQQDNYRWRADDGSETSATWLAAPRVNLESMKGANRVYRLRIQVSQTLTNANTGLTPAFKVRQSVNGGAYVDIGAQGTNVAVRYRDSPNIVHQAATTEQLAGDFTFIAGRIDEAGNSGTITFAGTSRQDTEIEFSIEVLDALVTAGATYDFRIYDTADAALGTYVDTPRMTITPYVAPNQPPATPSIISVEYV